MSRSHSFAWCIFIALSSFITSAVTHGSHQKRQGEGPAPLVNFQVTEPIFAPNQSSNQYGCIHTQTLMSHVFESSDGHPFIGEHSMP